MKTTKPIKYTYGLNVVDYEMISIVMPIEDRIDFLRCLCNAQYDKTIIEKIIRQAIKIVNSISQKQFRINMENKTTAELVDMLKDRHNKTHIHKTISTLENMKKYEKKQWHLYSRHNYV